MKRILLRLLVLPVLVAVLLTAASCSLLNMEQTFEKNGCSITLTKLFYEYDGEDADSYDFYYWSTKTEVFCYKNRIDDLTVLGITDETTVVGYAEIKTDLYGEDISVSALSEVNESDGLTWFTFTAPVEVTDSDGEIETELCHYCIFVFKSAGYFWEVLFCCEADEKAEQQPKFEKWAKTVVLPDTLDTVDA